MTPFLRASTLAVVLGLAAAVPAHAQPATRAVVIALMDDYPAFDPDVAARHPRARPLAALVFRHGPSGRADAAPVILLNPRMADARLLAHALAVLARCPAAGAPERDYIPIPPLAPAASAGANAAQEEAWLRSLQEQLPEDVRWLGGEVGRVMKVDGVRTCAAHPAGRPSRRP